MPAMFRTRIISVSFCRLILHAIGKHSVGHIIGMVAIYVKPNENTSNGCRINGVTLVFQPTHEIDLGFSSSKLELIVFQGPLLLTWFDFNPSMHK